tara:strand:+ start:2266 stop:4692 length:2427 start_codon:yes stop_codon:yes gene_type:complete
MQIKNKISLPIVSFLTLILFSASALANEFNISAVEIFVDKKNETIEGKGSVEALDKEGRVIKADKVKYIKAEELLLAEGFVEVIDPNGNILKTDKLRYDKIKNIIISEKNSVLSINEGYELKTNKILYNITDKIMQSDQNSILSDVDGNIVNLTMFQYDLEKKLFSSIGDIKIVDINNNKYFFKELYVDAVKKEMVGSDIAARLDQESFGVSKNNDPRFVANDIFVSKNKSNFSKAVFTVCKEKKGKCPPWSIQAKKISHDKLKKTIYYDHAILKVYDVPIFYFPKFFHPDPTVKRQSGFLAPFFTDSTSVGAGVGLPYYWAISNNKDITFTPKFYANENLLFLNEYRQAFEKGFLTLDTSYTAGYKNTSSTKTDGSRNHIFADLNINFAEDDTYDSKLDLKIQRTSNDTYFRVHDINTALVDAENTNLENKISYNFSKDDMYVDITATVYENLRKKTKDRYENIFPNIIYGKTFFTENFGSFDFKSNALYKNYDADKHTTLLTNDVLWNPNSFITRGGFVNSLKGQIKNTNYDAKNTTDYKTGGTVNEISGALNFKSSLPLKKEKNNFTKIFSPNLMLRYAPGHMKNLSGEDVTLNYANLYSDNKTSEIEDGLSAILGFDYKINEKTIDGITKQKFSLSVGQVFNHEENKDIPSRSSLDQKMSDIVGEIDYNFSEIGNISYKFSVDHNYNDLNYNEISSSFSFGRIDFNLDYLEEQNHVGDEHYISSGISLGLNENSKLSLSTKKNFKTESTELYNISYQYELDCLTASLVYRREFYEDSDLEENDTLMFTISFVPFTGISTPAYSP